MKQKLILIHEKTKKQNHELLDRIADNCYIDLLTGRFHCRKCHNVIHIDWSRNIAFCPIHGML